MAEVIRSEGSAVEDAVATDAAPADKSPIFELDLTEIQPMAALKQGCMFTVNNPSSGAEG
jgi:hypothetical protein